MELTFTLTRRKLGTTAALAALGAGLYGLAHNLPRAEAQPPTAFPFVLPWDDASETATSVAHLNPAPLTDAQKLTARDGHFYDTTGRRVRFVGVSIGAGAAFPTKEDAPQIAARLHKYGINLVRLHHMDARWSTPNLFSFRGGYNKTTTLDPQSLDRLEFFIAELKKHGVYVDLNLHVSREWLPGDGFPAGSLPELGKVLAYFHPHAIALQKQFAAQVLTHRSPYTGQPLATDPVLALVELNNEDSLVSSAGQAAALPPALRKPLEAGWNAYLKRKYTTTAALKSRWSRAQALGNELLKQSPQAWTVETHDQTKMTLAAAGTVAHLKGLKTDSTNWHLQLHQTGLTLEPGKTYTVSFSARASAPRTAFVNARLDQAPWTMVGLDSSVALGTAWKRYSLTFVANTSVLPEHSRLSFMLGDSAAEVFIKDWSLRPGSGGAALTPGQSLEAGTVELGQVSGSAAGIDYTHYLMTVEAAFSDQLTAAVRATGCTAPVTCSQASYGGIAGVYRESQRDWVDMHAYWQHPSFPGKAFDANNFRIENTPMVADKGAGTLDSLAMHRVAGKPFTVSEYDHPAPSEYSAEQVPLIFAYAAWQDWDGVFLFAYETGRSEKITGFFDQQLHPAKLGFLPAAASLFLRGDLAPAPNQMTLTVPNAKVAPLKALGSDGAFWSLAESRFVVGQSVGAPEKADARAFLTHRAALRFEPDPGPIAFGVKQTSADPPGFLWDHEQQVVTVNTAASKALIGKLGGKTFSFSGFTATIDSSPRNFAVVTLTSRDGKPTSESRTLLLTAVDKAENPGLTWNAERTFAANAWEKGPTQVEVPHGTIRITTNATQATGWALDGTGKRRKAIPTTLSNGTLTVPINSHHQTIWYEITLS